MMKCELCSNQKEFRTNRWCSSCGEMLIGLSNFLRRVTGKRK